MLHLLNGLFCLWPHIVTDAYKADNYNVPIDFIFHQPLLRIAEGKDAHCFCRQFVNLTIQRRFVNVTEFPIPIQIFRSRSQQAFRRAFVKGFPLAVNPRLAEFIGGIKALGPGNHTGFICFQPTEGFLPDKFHQRLVGSIPANHPVLPVEHGLGIFPNCQIQQMLYLPMASQFRDWDGTAVCGKKIHHFQHTLGNGPRLIAK